MVKSILALSILGIFFAACKKKETTTSSTTSIPDTPYTVSNATSFYGIFASSSGTQVFSPTYTQIYKYSDASFSNTLVNSPYPPNAVKVNSVFLNDENIKFDSTYSFYRSSIPSDLKTECWLVNGANGIPSFNYTSIYNNPTCNDFYVLPDSISLSAGFSVDIKGVVNLTTTENELMISDMSNNSLGQSQKHLNNGNNHITFTPSDLSNLHVTNNGTIFIFLENTRILNFFGKDFKFTKQRSFSKTIKIKP